MPDNQQGSGFINFDRFKNLNQFAADQNANKLADSLNKRGDAAQNAQTGANSKFNQAADAGTVRFNQPQADLTGGNYNPMKRQSLPSAGLYGKTNYGASDSGGKDDPNTSVGYDPNAAANAAVTAKQVYSGPQDLQSSDPKAYQAMLDEDQAVQNQTAGLGSESGLAAYLQNANAGGGYTPAMSAFDAALYGQSQPGKFQQLSTKYKNLLSGLTDAQEASKATSKNAQDKSAAASAQAGAYAQGQEEEKAKYAKAHNYHYRTPEQQKEDRDMAAESKKGPAPARGYNAGANKNFSNLYNYGGGF